MPRVVLEVDQRIVLIAFRIVAVRRPGVWPVQLLTGQREHAAPLVERAVADGCVEKGDEGSLRGSGNCALPRGNDVL